MNTNFFQFAFVTLACSSLCWAGSLRIENKLYILEADAGSGEFSISHKPSGKSFAVSGKSSAETGTAKVVNIEHPTFGKGAAIEVQHGNGNRETLALFDSLPFVTCEANYSNKRHENLVLNKVPAVSVRLDLGKKQNELTTLGTAGLLPAANNPGSYSFLAVADPQTRSGVVAGWIGHDRASGIIFSPVKENAIFIEARSDYGKLLIKPGTSAKGELFALGYFEDARLGLEQYGDALGKFYGVKLNPNRPGHCTWYMEKHGTTSTTEADLVALAEAAAKNLKPFGFDFMQIDDGWQQGAKVNGPARSFMGHLPDRYPSGMKATAEKISALGLRPGIWFIPFAGTRQDQIFKEHPEWFVKDGKGEPYLAKWGGDCLDMTHPGARDYLKGLVHRIVHEWGYKFLKLDGFWTGSGTPLTYVNRGYLEDNMGDATFSNPEKTNVEALRDGAKLLRQAAGADSFLLGCCISQNLRSLAGSIGLVDAMRVGPDTGSGEIGWSDATRLWFLHGRVWWNDPDCVSVRSSILLNQARLNASFPGFTGQHFLNSDWLPDLPEERLEVIRRCIPGHTLPARPVDIFNTGAPSIWHLSDSKNGVRRDAVALFNWSAQSANITATAERIGLPTAETYVGFDFWAKKFVPPFKGNVGGMMPGKSTRILSIRPASNVPQLISTSRHLLQGITDLEDEKWEGSSLSAASKLVANDPYEIRVVVPTGSASWKITEATLSQEDAAAGVKVEFKQDGPRIRATVQSPESRTVRWSLGFEPGEVQIGAPDEIKGLKAETQYQAVWLSWEENGADSYKVTRNDGVVVITGEPKLTDKSVKPEKIYSYSVCALGWDGSTGPAVNIEAPSLIQLPPTPPLPTVYINNLQAFDPENPAQKARIHTHGSAITARKAWENAVRVIPPAAIAYAIPAKAERFVAMVGLDDIDIEDNSQNVCFEVYGDVKEMGEKPELMAQSPVLGNKTVRTWAFDVPLNTRFKELRLVATEQVKPKRQFANWLNAGFILKQEH